MGRPTRSDAVGSAWSANERDEPYLGINRGALHLVDDVSGLFQISDMSTVRIEGFGPRRSFREGINKELLNAAWVDLEMEFVRDRVQPALETEGAD